MSPEPGFEHNQLRGITIKNMIVTIVCTATIVSTFMGAVFSMKSDISDVKYRQDEQYKIMDLRLRLLEDQQKLMSAEIHDLQNARKP